MDLALGYGITGFFCAVACVIIAVQAMRSGTTFVPTEPLAIAAIAGAVMGASWLNWYPEFSDKLCAVAIGLSVLSAWAAWKDATVAARLANPSDRSR